MRAIEPRLVYLRQGYPLIDLADAVRAAPRRLAAHATGDRVPFDSRDVAHRDFLFPLTVPPGAERTYLPALCLAGAGRHQPVIARSQRARRDAEPRAARLRRVLRLRAHAAGVERPGVRRGARPGVLSRTSPTSPLFGIYMTVNTGFAFQYLWPDSPRWGNTCLIVLLSLALITALHFSTTILRARDYTPRLERVARGLQVLARRGARAGRRSSTTPCWCKPVALLILVSVIFMIALGIVSLLAGSRPARFYVIAWGAFLAGSIIFLLKNFGAGAAHLHEPAQLAGGRAARNDPAVDDAEQPHERAQAPEPHRSAHAARQPPPVRRPPAHRIRARAPGEPAAVAADARHRQLQGLQRPARTRARRRGHQAGGRGAAPPRAQAGARLPLRRRRVLRDPAGHRRAERPRDRRTHARQRGERARRRTSASPSAWATPRWATDEFASHDKLFDAADAALYCAKEAGRNRVAGFRGPPRRRPAAPRQPRTPA